MAVNREKEEAREGGERPRDFRMTACRVGRKSAWISLFNPLSNCFARSFARCILGRFSIPACQLAHAARSFETAVWEKKVGPCARTSCVKGGKKEKKIPRRRLYNSVGLSVGSRVLRIGECSTFWKRQRRKATRAIAS